MVIADYDKIENFMKIDAQMDPKSHPKIGLGDTSSMFFCLFHPLVCGMVNYMFSVSGRGGQQKCFIPSQGGEKSNREPRTPPKSQTGGHGLRSDSDFREAFYIIFADVFILLVVAVIIRRRKSPSLYLFCLA